jgi:hypothetical protein
MIKQIHRLLLFLTNKESLRGTQVCSKQIYLYKHMYIGRQRESKLISSALTLPINTSSENLDQSKLIIRITRFSARYSVNICGKFCGSKHQHTKW